MDISVKYGRDPLWASQLPRDDLETLMAYDWALIEEGRRAQFASQIAQMRAMGAKVTKGGPDGG